MSDAWLGAVTLYALAPFGVVLLARARHQGLWWDFAMAIGLAAAVGLALLPLLSARWWAPQYPDSAFLRMVQRVHRDLAYVLTAFMLLHVGVLLLLEPRVIEYLKPGASPAMLVGLVAVLCSVALLMSSPRGTHSRLSYRAWRYWHMLLSFIVITLTLWHVLGAGFYHHSAGQRFAVLWLLVIPTVLTWWLRRKAWSRQHGSVAVPQRAPHKQIVAAITLSWLAAACWFAMSGAYEPQLIEQPLCQIEPCL
jgi:Ferric reductase like transmembrane component